MMPLTNTVPITIEYPCYVLVTPQNSLIYSRNKTGASPLGQPVVMSVMTQSAEYAVLQIQSNVVKLLSLGMSINFFTETEAKIAYYYTKFTYEQSDETAYAPYDKTWFPVDYDKKTQQRYKTYLPDDLQGEDFMDFSRFETDLLARFKLQTTASVVSAAPTENTCIGSIVIQMTVAIKRRPVLKILNSVLQIAEKNPVFNDTITEAFKGNNAGNTIEEGSDRQNYLIHDVISG